MSNIRFTHDDLTRVTAEIEARDARIAQLEQQLSAAQALLHDSRSKFSELYVTLATEDLSVHDLRELRTLADQGGLAIDLAIKASP